MKLTIDGKTLDYDPGQLTNKELIAIQKATGLGSTAFLAALGEGDMLAITGFVWALERRDDPGLRFDDVEFTVTSFNDGLQYDDDEVRDKLATLDPEQRDPFLASLPEEQRARIVDPTDGGTPAP